MFLNCDLQNGDCYFERDVTSSMFTELLGLPQEKENAGFKIIFCFEQLQPSTSPHFYFWLVK